MQCSSFPQAAQLYQINERAASCLKSELSRRGAVNGSSLRWEVIGIFKQKNKAFSSSKVVSAVAFSSTAAYAFNMSTISIDSMILNETTAWSIYNHL